ncbi:MAG: hypothetical protein AB7H81_23670 [Vicinamibacterales bacterium]
MSASAGQTREAIVANASRLRREIDETFNDAAHWNRTHPGEAPIDPDPDGQLRRIAEGLDRFLAREAVQSGDGDPITWVTGPDTGVSSLTIWHVLMRRPMGRLYPDVPHDPDDFGRCYRLLQWMPSWRARLGEVAAQYPAWLGLVDAWDELTEMFERVTAGRNGWDLAAATEMYARMRELRGEPPIGQAPRVAPPRGRR